MAETNVSTHDRAVALRWAHALEHPVSHVEPDLRADFKERAALLRRLTDVGPDEDISQYFNYLADVKPQET